MNTTNPALTPLLLLKCWLDGWRLLKQPALRKFVLWPVLVNIVFYSLALWVGYHYVDIWVEQLLAERWIWLRWILWPLFFIGYFSLVFFSFTLLANLLLAPFYGKLAQQTLALVSGRPVQVQDAAVGKVIWSEVRRLGYILRLSLPVIVLSVVPGLNILAPLAWMLLGAWTMALEYLAYPLENDGLLFAAQKQLLASMRLRTLLYGVLLMLGLTVPLLNILIAPLGVIVATLYLYQLQIIKA